MMGRVYQLSAYLMVIFGSLGNHYTLFPTPECRTRLRTLALTFGPRQGFYKEQGINRCMGRWDPMLLKSNTQVNTNLIVFLRSCFPSRK